MSKEKGRAKFGRIGFILVSAGCAIGIGNVWKFPYVAGQNGGAVFLLFYLFFLVIMGIPVLVMELSMGRASRKSILQGYKTLEKKGAKWHIHGWFCVAGSYILMMYYTVVGGWMLAYCWKFASGEFEGRKGDEVGAVFDALLSNPGEMGIFTGIIILGGFLVLSFGVKKGLEGVNKFMMTGLLVLIAVLAINSVTLPNASEGLKFYLLPDLNRIKDGGFGKMIVAAMNQAFFTLSIGIGSMEIMGSYMAKDYTLAGEAVKITALDTMVAFVSGLIIFPACFAFGVEPAEGPSLIFVALPHVFTDMSGGRIWGALFFLFMTFASFSTVTAVFENIIGSTMENFKLSRGKTILLNAGLVLLLSIPCILGFNLWANVRLIGGRAIMESEDFIVSNILLPAGSLIFVIFCMHKFGWGAEKFFAEANEGAGLKISPKLTLYFKYVLPALILIILVSGFLS